MLIHFVKDTERISKLTKPETKNGDIQQTLRKFKESLGHTSKPVLHKIGISKRNGQFF